MRVGRTAGIIVAVVMIAAIATGLGFALSPLYGYSYSENNTTGTSDMTIDVYVNNGQGYVPLTTSMVFPAYSAGNTAEVSGDYEVVVQQDGVDTTGYVRLWCDMANDSSWVLIERMYVTFEGILDNHDELIEYDFGIAVSNGQVISGVPTAAVEIDGATPFTIYVEFKDFPYSVDDSGDDLNVFAGSKFVFAFDGTDPLS